MSIKSSSPQVCQWLGSTRDRATCYSYASQRNCCYAVEPPAPLTRDHQERYCLAAAFTGCPRHVAKSRVFRNKADIANGGEYAPSGAVRSWLSRAGSRLRNR